MTSALETVTEFMEVFERAWAAGDAASVAQCFSENAVYHNIPLEPAQGRAAIEATVEMMMQMGGTVGVEMVNLLADESRVMTERVDHFVVNGKKISLPVMGVFEVQDGLITAWRDYFDLNQFMSAMTPDVG